MKSPLMVVELDHVVLRCRQQDRTLDFYSRVLGLKEERRIGQLGLIQLRAGASMVDLVPTVEPRVDTGTNVDHFCLGIETDDLGSVISYLRSNSVEILGEPAIRYSARGMGNSIYVRDPEGNIIELKQTPGQGQATLG
jgi:glyoxylase I family protein